MAYYKKKNFRRGLTFMELMVVVAIIGIISAVTLVNLGGSKAQKSVEIAARQVAGAIRQAQSYALSGKQEGTATVCGWGFHFDNDPAGGSSDAKAYQIFYNTKCDLFEYDETLADSKNSISTSLQNNINFEASDKSIYFSIPFGTAYDKAGQLSSSNNLQVKLISSSSSSAKYTVCVYSSGRVEELAPGGVDSDADGFTDC